MELAYIYTKPACSSSRKAIQFFRTQNIPYREIKLQHQTIDPKHLNQALLNSDKGFEDLVKRTVLPDLLDLKVEQAKSYILDNPVSLRTPFVVQGPKTLSGYHEEEYGMFQSRDKRKHDLEIGLHAV